MATFDQRGQVVGTQYNADSITIHPQATRPLMREVTGPPPVDVVLITPLEEERDAVLAQLAGYRQLPPTQDDIRVYYAAELPVTFPDGAAATYRVIVAPLLNMGRVEAANATGDAIRRWRPRYVWLVGIAGGLAKAGVALGDVLVADQVADYELQKLTAEATSIRWQVHRVDPRLLGAARNLRGDGWHRLVTCARPEAGAPRRHIGPICTGDKVIADGLLDEYRDVWAKLVGVEMEAGGTASAAFQAAQIPGFFMVRGVSDLADAAKDSDTVDRWRAYACDVAAAHTIGLLRSGPIPLETAEESARPEREPHASEPFMRDISNTDRAQNRSNGVPDGAINARQLMRAIYAFVGASIGAIVDLGVNLLAAVIQQRTFGEQFNRHAMGWLIGLIVVGLLLGVWLSTAHHERLCKLA